MLYRPIGRYVFGAATIAFGIVALTWHEYNGVRIPRDVWAAGGVLVVYVVAAGQLLGGAAMLVRRFAHVGALVGGATYVLFALLCISKIAAAPRVYDTWGNFFEQFSLVLGAAYVYAAVASRRLPANAIRYGGMLFGVCAMSFAIEQAIHPNATSSLVPAWLPPNRSFWTNATTLGFVLAALALFVRQRALLATRLMTAMLVTFGVVVWLPLLTRDPHDHGNVGETIETFAIAGAAWILADLLESKKGAI